MREYIICNDWNEKNERYYFICVNGEPLCDELGESIRFNSFEDAEEYINIIKE